MHPKLQLSKMALILKEPFFAHLSLHLHYVEDRSIPTAATNGHDFRYNPDFIDGLSDKETTFVVCHEVLHCALGHVTRRGGRHPEKWNIAADYVVNDVCLDSGFKPIGQPVSLPELLSGAKAGGDPDTFHHLYDPALKGLSAEDIYSRLPDAVKRSVTYAIGQFTDPGKKPGAGDGQGKGAAAGPGQGSGDGDGESEGSGDSPSDAGALEAKWRVTVAQAANTARAQGKLPAHIARLVEELLHPKLPWTALLRQFVRELAVADYTWLRPQRAMLATHGMLLPSLKSEVAGDIVVVVDTSGSVDGPLLAEFTAEIQSILDEVRPKSVTALDCDAKVHTVREYQPGDTIENQWQGGGGTSFVPPFDYVEANGLSPCCFIYLTDMYGDFPKHDPGYPVLWISYSNVDKAPFGTVIQTKS